MPRRVMVPLRFAGVGLSPKGSRKAFTDLQTQFPYAVNITGALATIDLELLPPTTEG